MQFAQNDLCTAPESYLDNEGIFFIWTTRAYFLLGQGGLIFHLTGRAYFQQETLIGQPCHIDPDQSSEMVNTLESDLDRF